MGVLGDKPSGYVKIIMKNHHVQWENLYTISMVMFNTYVELPEGIVTLRKWNILYKLVPPPVISRFIIP